MIEDVVDEIKMLSWKWCLARLRIHPCLYYEGKWDPRWCLGHLCSRVSASREVSSVFGCCSAWQAGFCACLLLCFFWFSSSSAVLGVLEARFCLFVWCLLIMLSSVSSIMFRCFLGVFFFIEFGVYELPVIIGTRLYSFSSFAGLVAVLLALAQPNNIFCSKKKNLSLMVHQL